MLDLIIRDARIVDGSGAPAVPGAVGVRDGRIVAVGKVDEPARRTIDADGLTITPGFIDPHVHYDAQIMWDAACTPSCFYGVTTVIGGNCGFGVAPLGAANADYMLRLLANVEGMTLDALRRGSDWSWSTYPEWLDRLRGHVAVNAAFFCGHSTIRRAVLGDDCACRAATPAEVSAMAALLDVALQHGAVGLSTSLNENHHDGDGEPVPSRSADRAELFALVDVLRRYPGTVLEIVPAMNSPFDDAAYELLTQLSLAAGGTVLWNSLAVDATSPEWHEAMMRAAPYAADRGASVAALSIPDVSRLRLSFGNGMILQAFPGWAPLFALSADERIAALGDPGWRERLREGLAQTEAAGLFGRFSNFAPMRIGEAVQPHNRALNGRTVADAAAERGVDVLDLVFDLSIEESLTVGFWPPATGDDDASWALRADVWQRDDVLVGGGDAGAHLDAIDSFTYPAVLAGTAVRERNLLPFETAVRLLTAEPAAMFGLHDRGVIRVGAAADLLLLDPATFAPGELEMRTDLPGGAQRLYSQATGLHRVFVNGNEVVADGALLDAGAAGAVLGRTA